MAHSSYSLTQNYVKSMLKIICQSPPVVRPFKTSAYWTFIQGKQIKTATDREEVLLSLILKPEITLC